MAEDNFGMASLVGVFCNPSRNPEPFGLQLFSANSLENDSIVLPMVSLKFFSKKRDWLNRWMNVWEVPWLKSFLWEFNINWKLFLPPRWNALVKSCFPLPLEGCARTASSLTGLCLSIADTFAGNRLELELSFFNPLKMDFNFSLAILILKILFQIMYQVKIDHQNCSVSRIDRSAFP